MSSWDDVCFNEPFDTLNESYDVITPVATSNFDGKSLSESDRDGSETPNYSPSEPPSDALMRSLTLTGKTYKSSSSSADAAKSLFR